MKTQAMIKKICLCLLMTVLLFLMAPVAVFAENEIPAPTEESAVAEEIFEIIEDELIPAAPADSELIQETTAPAQAVQSEANVPETASTLPQTSGIPAIVFFTLGSLISVAGCALWIRNK